MNKVSEGFKKAMLAERSKCQELEKEVQSLKNIIKELTRQLEELQQKDDSPLR